MKKVKLIVTSLLFTVGALAGCGKEDPKPHEHTYATEWSSDETFHWHASTCGHDVVSEKDEHAFDEEGYCSICKYYDESKDSTRVFTDEKLGKLVGDFYGFNYSLEISKEGAKLSSGDAEIILVNDHIRGSGFETVVSYKDANGNVYLISWDEAYWDATGVGYMVPTLSVGESSIQFQPSIEEACGWYDGWDGTMDYGMSIYILTNDFDPVYDSFVVNAASLGYSFFGLGFWAKSAFIEVDGKVELGISWCQEDEIEAGVNDEYDNFYLVKDSETGQLVLADVPVEGDDSYYEWWTRPSMFLFEFVNESISDATLTEIFDYYSYDSYMFDFDEDAKQVSVSWSEYFDYVEGFDEKGAYVLIDGAKYRGTSFGLSIEKDDTIQYCVPFFFYNFYDLTSTNYVSGDLSVSLAYDWDNWEFYVDIDGEPADNGCLAIYNGTLYIKAVKGDDTYYFGSYDGTEAVEVFKNDVRSVYVNEGLSYQFAGEFYTSTFGYCTVGVDASYTKGEVTLSGSLTYIDEYGVVIVLENGAILARLSDTYNMLAYFSETEADVLTETSIFDAQFGEYTSGLVNLSVGTNSVTIGERTFPILGLSYLVDSLGDVSPAFVFGDNSGIYYALLGDATQTQVYKNGAQGLQFVSSFITTYAFEKIYGEYDFVGEFGLEKVIVEKNGKLFVSTSNETGDGTIIVEYAYDAFMNDGEVVLEFVYKGYPVDIIFDGNGHCNIFDIRYLGKVYFDNQGLYGNSKDNYLSVVDSVVKYNGEEVTVLEMTSNSIIGICGEFDLLIEFTDGNASVKVGEAEPVVLEKNSVQLSSFNCEVKENVSNLSRDIKVENGVIYIRNTGDEAFQQVTDFEYVIDDSGNVSIKFANSLVYTFTISIVDNVVVITGESSLPPLPPVF